MKYSLDYRMKFPILTFLFGSSGQMNVFLNLLTCKNLFIQLFVPVFLFEPSTTTNFIPIEKLKEYCNNTCILLIQTHQLLPLFKI